jgi:hypothetical protein
LDGITGIGSVFEFRAQLGSFLDGGENIRDPI